MAIKGTGDLLKRIADAIRGEREKVPEKRSKSVFEQTREMLAPSVFEQTRKMMTPSVLVKIDDSKKLEIQNDIFDFRMRLLRVHPFYGDVLLKLPIVMDESIPTACTDGKNIRYNPSFFASKTKEEYCYILMHEVMHVLMMHCFRRENRKPDLWNVACDFVVNDMVNMLAMNLTKNGIVLKTPNDALVFPDYLVAKESAETMYEKLLDMNSKIDRNTCHFVYGSGKWAKEYRFERIPSDVIVHKSGISEADKKVIEETVKGLIRSAVSNCKDQGLGTMDIPKVFLRLTESKKLNWKLLLRDFLEEGASDESSYFTPERKYLHMDLIIPGPEERREELGEVWAFIDDSGSISKNELDQFLTQLYRIMKDVGGRMNVAFWNTKVDAVYSNITDQKKLMEVVPKGSGGTNASCVYEYMKNNHIRPEVLILLTDGCFAPVSENLVTKSMRKKTIVVLSDNRFRNDDSYLNALGKIASLK